MPQLTDPFSQRTATRPLDLYPAPGSEPHDTQRQRRLVSVVVAIACVVTLALAALLGSTGLSRSGADHAARSPEAAGVATVGVDPVPAPVTVAPVADGGTGAATPEGAASPDAADQPAPNPGTNNGTENGTDNGGQTDPPGQLWATVRIVSPTRLTVPAGEPANLWATATLDDGTPVANAKLRWRIWSEPEHALVYSHQGWHAVTPALPVGRYTVGISVVDPKVSGGLKRTLVVEEERVLVPPTPKPPAPTPNFTGPDAIKPATPDGP